MRVNILNEPIGKGWKRCMQRSACHACPSLEMFEEVPASCRSSCVRINTSSRFTFRRIPLQPIRHMSDNKPAAPCSKTLLEIAKRAVSETRLVDANKVTKIDESMPWWPQRHIQPTMVPTIEVSGKLKWHAFLDPAQFNLLDAVNTQRTSVNYLIGGLVPCCSQLCLESL